MFSEIQWTTQTIAITGVFAIPVVSILAYYWYRATKARAEANLKQTLAKKGMSADEIERVVNSGKH